MNKHKQSFVELIAAKLNEFCNCLEAQLKMNQERMENVLGKSSYKKGDMNLPDRQ